MAKQKTPQQLEAEATRLLERADRLIAAETNDKFKVFATKIEPTEARKFERICEIDGATPYEVIQMLIASYIRIKDPGEVLTEHMKQLMVAFELTVHLTDRLQLTDPSAKALVQEATYFIGDPEHKGMRLVHVYKPFMGDAEQTENIKELLERTIEEMPVLYRKLRQLCKVKRADSIYELLCKLCEEFDGIEDANEIEETFADCERSEFGKRMDEVRTKRTMINKMEAFERRQTSLWTEEDQINETF